MKKKNNPSEQNQDRTGGPDSGQFFPGENWLKKRIAAAVPEHAYKSGCDFSAYRKLTRHKLTELLGIMPDYTRFTAEITEKTEGYSGGTRWNEIRLRITTEDDTFPCALAVPLTANEKNPAPVALCLQGHGSAMRVSFGRVTAPHEKRLLGDRMDFAVQAVQNGCAAFCVEMRGMGSRSFIRAQNESSLSCYRPAMAALLFGQTLAGLRVADTRSAVSALISLDEPAIDTSRILCLGHSGGGTTAFYTTCLDSRLCAVAPSCCLCGYESSILETDHCSCNYIPKLFSFCNMSDLAAAIFPRPILCSAGKADSIFPIEGIRDTFAKIQSMYAENGEPQACTLDEGNDGHVFFADLIWPRIRSVLKP